MILEAATLSGSGRPLLLPGEIERLILDKVDLHFDQKSGPPGVSVDVLEDGSVSLTSHRLIWVDMRAAPAAGNTFALPLHAVADAQLYATHIFAVPKVRIKVCVDRSDKPVRAGPSNSLVQIKVVAKEQQVLRDQLQAALAQKAWETAPSPSTSLGPLPPPREAMNFSPLQAALVDQVDDTHVSSLQSMGFSRERSHRAVAATQGAGVESAVQWLMEREGDRTLDAPLPQSLGQSLSGQSPLGSLPTEMPSLGTGVAGILKREQLLAARTDTVLDQAFVDLRGLMSTAGELVALAQRFREILAEKAAKEGGSSEAGADWDPQLEADLVMMGIPSPVTRQMAGAGYLQHLARELADFLGPRVETSGGMMPLTDCYCLFNRARGTELISPDDLLAALQLLPEVHAPLRCRQFESGVTVVESTTHSQEKVFERLGQLTGLKGLGVAISASDVAAALKVPLAVATEHLSSAEGAGVLCRDDGPEGLRFFRNFFADPETVLVSC